MFGTKSAKRISFASAYLPKRQQHNVAGFLTCSWNRAFPSFDSDILRIRFQNLQQRALCRTFTCFPLRILAYKILHHFAVAKIHFFRKDTYLKYVETQCIASLHKGINRLTANSQKPISYLMPNFFLMSFGIPSLWTRIFMVL